MTPNLKYDPKTKFLNYKLFLGLIDHFELSYVKIGRIRDFKQINQCKPEIDNKPEADRISKKLQTKFWRGVKITYVQNFNWKNRILGILSLVSEGLGT